MARLPKTGFPAVVILGMVLMSSRLPAENSGRWTVEISGTLQFLAKNNLDGLVDSEKSYLNLYFRGNPAYQTISYPGLSKPVFAMGGGIAAHYRLSSRLRMGIGLDILLGNSGNGKTFVFRLNQGWRTVDDSLEYRRLDTRINLFFPHVSLGYTFPLNEKLELALGVQAGPVFARGEWNRHIVDTMDVRETDTGNRYRLYQDERNLTMKGDGTGIGAGTGLTFRWRLSRLLGVFLEAGYRFFFLPALSGSSSLSAGGVERNWEGEWFLVEENVEREWGSRDFSYPSNDPYLLPRSTGKFQAEIHAAPSLRLGISIIF